MFFVYRGGSRSSIVLEPTDSLHRVILSPPSLHRISGTITSVVLLLLALRPIKEKQAALIYRPRPRKNRAHRLNYQDIPGGCVDLIEIFSALRNLGEIIRYAILTM